MYHGVGARANDDPTEYFLTCLHLLVNVGLALRDLVGSFKVAATARGYANRVEGLYAAIDAVPTLPPVNSASPALPSPAVLVLDKLSVASPDGAPLVRHCFGCPDHSVGPHLNPYSAPSAAPITPWDPA